MKLVSISATAVIALASASQAATVSFFLDGAYGDVGEENANQRADLVDSGNIVNDFSGIADGDWAAALSGADALVIPELEVSDVSADLSALTISAIQDFVSMGGNLVTTNEFGYGLTFLNTVLGTSFTGGYLGTANLTAAGALTEFGAGPASLLSLNSVDGADLASLGGATSVYDDGSAVGVLTFAYGAGNVTFLGYDWFEGQDADWATVQDIAVNLDVAAVPLPASSLLLLAGLGGLGLARSKRKA